MIRPSLDKIQELAKSGQYDIAPVCMEILSDFRTPIEVLRVLKNISGHCYLLESVADNEKWGRYTFLGYDPKEEITCTNGNMRIGSLSLKTNHPDQYLRQILAKHRSPRFEDLPSFTGGLVGYFSYDYLKYAEPSLHLDAEDTESFQDVDLMLFDDVIAFDHYRQKILLISNISLESPEENYNAAILHLRNMADLIRHGRPKQESAGKMTSEIQPLFDKETYCSMVRKAKHHIKEGDIFQIVLSNRLEAEYEGSLLNTYRILRTLNPSVLTEPRWFQGDVSHLQEIAQAVSIPVLRKDFVVDDYMIYEAKVLGADAVLLICAILSKEQIRSSLALCDTLGLSAIVEAHDAKEIRIAAEAGVRIIGINNRNLKDFSVHPGHSTALSGAIPAGTLFVAESGIRTAAEVAALASAGADAVLIGESMMRAGDKQAKLKELKGDLR